MVKQQWFKSYVPGQEPARFDLVLQSWDTANKSTELSDFRCALCQLSSTRSITGYSPPRINAEGKSVLDQDEPEST
jgi:hypothetical protein